jgi:hypothetical protein
MIDHDPLSMGLDCLNCVAEVFRLDPGTQAFLRVRMPNAWRESGRFSSAGRLPSIPKRRFG